MSRKKSRGRPGDGAASNTNEVVDTAAETDGAPEDEAARAARREQQKREWAEQKARQERAQRSNAPYIWGGGIAAVLAVVVIGGVVLLSGGGDDDGDAANPTPTPDRRIAGLPIDVSLTVNMNDSGQAIDPRFEPDTITAEAGQVIEILAPNVGSVVHNLRIAGLNGEYEAGAPSSDDWVTYPESVDAGETGRLVVKIDEPGSYPFKCDFHIQQVGTLILN